LPFRQAKSSKVLFLGVILCVALSSITILERSTPASAEYTIQVTFWVNGVQSDYSGTILTVDGSTFALSQLTYYSSDWRYKTLTWSSGTSHSFAYSSPLQASSSKRYVWTSTSGLSTAQSGTVTSSSSSNIYGYYKTQYQLTINSVYGNPQGQGWYDSGATATFSVTSPVSGGTGIQYVCTGYSGGASGSGTSGTIAMNAPKTVTFNYKTQFQLTIQVSPSGTGTTSPAPGSYWYDSGQTVSISATPSTNCKFDSWSGDITGTSNPTSTAMSGSKSITANFVTRANPSVALTPNSQSGVIGSTLTYTVSVKNNDPTSFGASAFSLTYSVPSGWSASLSRTSVTVSPGGTDSSITLSVTSPSTASAGMYTVSVTATNTGTTGYAGTGTATVSAQINWFATLIAPALIGTTLTCAAIGIGLQRRRKKRREIKAAPPTPPTPPLPSVEKPVPAPPPMPPPKVISTVPSVEVICPRCGTTLPPSAKFCGICGTKLS